MKLSNETRAYMHLGLAIIREAYMDLACGGVITPRMRPIDRVRARWIVLRAAGWLHSTSTAPGSFRWWVSTLTALGCSLPDPEAVRSAVRPALEVRRSGRTITTYQHSNGMVAWEGLS